MGATRLCLCVENLAACGAQQVVRHLVVHLDRERFTPIVYTFRDGPLREPIERSGIGVRVLRRRLPRLDPGLVLGLARALRRDAVQLLHMHLFGACLHGTLATMGLPLRRVITLHSDRPDNVLQSVGYPLVARAADAVIAVSRHAGEALETRYTGLASRMTIIPNGIDLAPFDGLGTKQRARQALDLPQDRLLVGTVGRLAAEKGHDALLAAFAGIRALLPNVHLLIAGDGELRASLQASVIRLGIDDAVTFLGSRSDVPQLLTAIDVCVLNSRFEGLPLVLLEAMAAGTPLVATGVGGITEVVTPEDAFIVPPGDTQQLQCAIHRALTEPSLTRRLTQNARAKVHHGYTARRMAGDHEALYEDLARRSLPSRWPLASIARA